MPDGELIEGKGVVPDYTVKPSLEDLLAGKGVQIERTVREVLAL
jgi:C-terminal processing protease CtpA/Prc